KIQRDPKKGDFYVALIEKPGRATLEVLADMLPVIIRTFPWPKSMRSGERLGRPGSLQWVRPLHSIVATFGMETEEPDVVKFAVDGIEAGQTTYGHRFMVPAPIGVRRFEDYQAKLHAAKVVLEPHGRKDIIQADARQLAFAQGFELVEDEALLDEVAGLVEWPLAAEIAPLVGADVEKTKRAARLAKADLLTDVVGEFPELQGLMGKYYALAQGEDAAVAAASEDHYKPQGPTDRVPTDPVSIAVALADKIDTLAGFWAIDEKPT